MGTVTSGSNGSTTAVSPAHALCMLGPRKEDQGTLTIKRSYRKMHKTQKRTNLWPKVVRGQYVFMLSSRGSPRVVEFKTLIAEVGLAVSAALSGLQRLRRLTETTHDGHAAQTDCVPVPKGQTGEQEDKGRVKAGLRWEIKL